MRTPTLGSVQYQPAPVPNDASQYQAYLRDEFNKLAAAIGTLAAGHLDMQTVAPLKPRDGDIRYANGTTWNPAAGGKGLYMFTTVWTLVKALP